MPLQVVGCEHCDRGGLASGAALLDRIGPAPRIREQGKGLLLGLLEGEHGPVLAEGEALRGTGDPVAVLDDVALYPGRLYPNAEALQRLVPDD